MGQFVTHRRPTSRGQALKALAPPGRGVVYAIRLDDVIKIGRTTNLEKRFTTLQHYNDASHAEILGFREGTAADEEYLHLTLTRSLAHGQEYYHPTPQVMAVVNSMRREFGLPSLTS